MDNGIPPGWAEAKLGSALDAVLDFRGRTPLKLGMDWGGGGIHALSAANVRMNGLDLSKTAHFGSEALYKRWMTTGDPEKGDVLLTMEAPLGNVAQIPDDNRYILSQRVILLKSRKELLTPTFLAYQMRSACFQGLLRSGATGTTATGIRQSRLLELPISLPPLNEQRRIVAKLEDLLARSRRAKDALDAIPPLLEKLRQSILAAAFRGDLTADWRAKNPNVEPAEELLKRIRIERRKKWEEAELAKLRAKGKAPADDRWKAKYEEPEPVDASELPELPEGWCWATADQLCTAATRTGLSIAGSASPPGLRSLRLDALRGEHVDFSCIRYLPLDLESCTDLVVLPGDFLVSRGNGSLRLLGSGALAKDAAKEPTIFPDTAFRFRLHPEVQSWVTNIWPAHPIRAFIERKAKTTAGIYKIAQSDIVLAPIPVPPSQEGTVVGERIRTAIERVRELQQALTRITGAGRSLENSMLAKAFRGELVEQDPSEEPSSAMLERLAAERQAAQAAPTSDKRSPRQKARG